MHDNRDHVIFPTTDHDVPEGTSHANRTRSRSVLELCPTDAAALYRVAKNAEDMERDIQSETWRKKRGTKTRLYGKKTKIENGVVDCLAAEALLHLDLVLNPITRFRHQYSPYYRMDLSNADDEREPDYRTKHCVGYAWR